jgi:hypothetical protein
VGIRESGSGGGWERVQVRGSWGSGLVQVKEHSGVRSTCTLTHTLTHNGTTQYHINGGDDKKSLNGVE